MRFAILIVTLLMASQAMAAGFIVEINSVPPSRSSALSALEVAEKMLKARTESGDALAAKTLLQFIAAAKDQGALAQPVLVGHFAQDHSGAKFGSALSVTNTITENGAFVMVDVILSKSIEAFGYEGAEIHATFMTFARKDVTILKLQSGMVRPEISGNRVYLHHMDLTAELNPSAKSPTSWADVSFRATPRGVITNMELSDYEASCELDLRKKWKPKLLN
jgi:hypothetical protein